MRHINISIIKKSWRLCQAGLLAISLSFSLIGCGTAFLPGSITTEQLEEASAINYAKIISETPIAPDDYPDFVRLKTVASRLIPLTPDYNAKAQAWKWEVNLLYNPTELNAWCMAGGKIAFYTAIITKLKLTDDEIAMIMGHEMVHALQEHIYAQVNKGAFVNFGASIGAAALGGGDASKKVMGLAAGMLNLTFSRSDEKESDLIGQEMAARAGYNPEAAITVWEKMQNYSDDSSGFGFLSTHPKNENRITYLKENLPNVMPLYQKARQGRQ